VAALDNLALAQARVRGPQTTRSIANYVFVAPARKSVDDWPAISFAHPAGVPTLIFALVFFARTEIFLHRSVSAEGAVTRLVADRDETIHYAPVFTFATRSGRSMTVESHNYSAPPEFSVGEKVRVLYEEDHPERARIASHWQVHAAEEVCALIGLCFTGIGLGFLMYQRNWKRPAAGSAGRDAQSFDG
jgi:hypothetical protein